MGKFALILHEYRKNRIDEKNKNLDRMCPVTHVACIGSRGSHGLWIGCTRGGVFINTCDIMLYICGNGANCFKFCQ